MDDRILDFASGVDMIWHAGDIGNHEGMDALEQLGKPLIAVYGNIDDHTMRSRYPLHQKFVLNGVKVWITHIGG
ncbi:MAG TPA: YfcE family phosphodiesterase, partial [Cryomorphaceae bacterium]|nr:YfcE family phosphodiesterase [Cryomorphaceae bacterium]